MASRHNNSLGPSQLAGVEDGELAWPGRLAGVELGRPQPASRPGSESAVELGKLLLGGGPPLQLGRDPELGGPGRGCSRLELRGGAGPRGCRPGPHRLAGECGEWRGAAWLAGPGLRLGAAERGEAELELGRGGAGLGRGWPSLHGGGSGLRRRWAGLDRGLRAGLQGNGLGPGLLGSPRGLWSYRLGREPLWDLGEGTGLGRGGAGRLGNQSLGHLGRGGADWLRSETGTGAGGGARRLGSHRTHREGIVVDRGGEGR